MATTKDTPAAREQGDKSAVKASDLAAATAKDGVLFDVRDKIQARQGAAAASTPAV